MVILKNNEELPKSIEGEDNIIRKERKRKGYFKYLILLIVILISIKVAYDFVYIKPVNELEINGSLELDATSKYDFIAFGDNVISCSKNGIIAYNKNGKVKWKHEISVTAPKLKVNEKKLIVTDIPNKIGYVFDVNGNLKNTVNFDNECVNATTNNNGWVTAILRNKGYKSQVAVYNSEGKLQYSWNSANNNVISAELSDDNKTLAVAQIDSISSAEANGVISLFDITTDAKPYCGKNTGENIVTYIRWSGNTLLCVGSTDTFCIDKSGKDIYSYKYPGDMVLFNAKSNDLFAFAINETSTSATKKTLIYFVNNKGAELGSVEIDGDIKNITITGSNIAALGQNKLYFIKSDGKIKKEFTLTKDIITGIMYNDFKSIFVVSGTSSEIISLE